MNNTLPRTLTDLMFDAADALEERDTERLDELLQNTNEWTQTAEESAALEMILQTMADAAHELNG